MLNLFQYGFMVRALEVGLLIGAIAPLIGIFLVLEGILLLQIRFPMFLCWCCNRTFSRNKST